MIAALLRERGLAVLAAVLVAQLVILTVTRLPGRAAAPEPLLAGLTAESVTRIEIDDGADGRVVMVREESGWALSGAGGYPADAALVADLLDRLAASRRDRLVARTEAGRRELSVLPDDFERRVRIEAGTGEHLIYVGAAAGSDGAHVRVDGQDEVWNVDGLASWQVSADRSSWVDPVYVRVEPDRVAAFALWNAAGSFRFERTDAGWTWPDQVGGEAVDQERVTDFVDRFGSLRMRQPLGAEPPAAALDPPAAVVRIDLSPAEDDAADGAEAADSLEIFIHSGGADGAYVVKSADSEYYVEVSSFTLAELVDADRSAFVMTGGADESPSGDPPP